MLVGAILAGGQSRRMGGGDKPLIALAGKTLLARTVERLAPQVDRMVLNANGDPARFAAYGLPVAADVVPGWAGPLAGVLTALDWARAHAPAAEWVLSVAADTPLFPHDLAARLLAAARERGAEVAVACSGGRTHPVFGLWRVSLAEDLRMAVVEDGVRRIGAWAERHNAARALWPDAPFDPFLNANTPEDIQRLGAVLERA